MSFKTRGFTLLELVAVLIIVGIVSSIVFVSWPGNTTNLDGQAQQLANDLRYVQSLAMTNEQSYRVNFSATQYTFTESNGTTAVPHPAAGGSNVITLGAGMVLSTANLPNSYILYDKNGIPYTNTSGTKLAVQADVILTTTSSASTVSIEPETGTVLIPV